MKILMAGDVVGSPGRRILARLTTQMKQKGDVDVVVANAENAAGGLGLTQKLANELFAAGVDLLTLGDHAWNQREMQTYIDRDTRIVRPANFPPGCPGRGFTTLSTPAGSVTVCQLIGRVFMQGYDCPFRTIDAILSGETALARTVLVEVHAEATSEKIVLGNYLDGRVTAVVGTHTHVQTSDNELLPRGTAYITDLGMTGPRHAAIGRDMDQVTRMFLTGMPSPFKVGARKAVLEGVLLDVNEANGRARAIERVREYE